MPGLIGAPNNDDVVIALELIYYLLGIFIALISILQVVVPMERFTRQTIAAKAKI